MAKLLGVTEENHQRVGNRAVMDVVFNTGLAHLWLAIGKQLNIDFSHSLFLSYVIGAACQNRRLINVKKATWKNAR